MSEITYKCKFCSSENLFHINTIGGERLGYIHNFRVTPRYTIFSCLDCGKVTVKEL